MTDQTPTAVGEPFNGPWCSSCDVQVTEPTALYECSTCGEVSDERQCSSCKRFKSRADEDGCPECGEKIAEKTLVLDHDGAVILANDFEPNGAPYAERQARQRAESAARAKAETEARLAAKVDGAEEIAARGITPGMLLPDLTSGDLIARDRTVLHASTATDGRIVVVTDRLNNGIEIYDTDESVTISRESDTEPAALGRFIIEPGDPEVTSAVNDRLTVAIQSGTRDHAVLPMLTIQASRQYGGMVFSLGTWHDPALAAAGLDDLEVAARAYAQRLGVEATLAAAGVSVEDEGGWCLNGPTSEGRIWIGESSWATKPGALLHVEVARQNITLDDPSLLLAAVEVARGLVGRLTMIPTR